MGSTFDSPTGGKNAGNRGTNDGASRAAPGEPTITHGRVQKYAESIKALDEAVRLMPDNSGTIVALGWAKLAARDARAAERTFRQAVAVDRNFAEAHGGLASALALQGRADEAQQEAKLATGLDRMNFGGRFAQSVLLKIRGNTEAATELLAKLMQQAPTPDSKPLMEHLRTYGLKHLT